MTSNRYLSLVLADYLKCRGIAIKAMTHIDGDLANLKEILMKLSASFATKEITDPSASVTSASQRVATIWIDCDAFMNEQKKFGMLEKAHLRSIVQLIEDCMIDTSDTDTKLSLFSVEKFLSSEVTTPTRSRSGSANATKTTAEQAAAGSHAQVDLGREGFQLNIVLLTRYTADVTSVTDKHPKVRNLNKPPKFEDVRRLSRECGKPKKVRISGDLKGFAAASVRDEDEVEEEDTKVAYRYDRDRQTVSISGGEERNHGEEQQQTEVPQDRKERSRSVPSSLSLEVLDEAKTMEIIQPTIPRILVADDVRRADDMKLDSLLSFVFLFPC